LAQPLGGEAPHADRRGEDFYQRAISDRCARCIKKGNQSVSIRLHRLDGSSIQLFVRRSGAGPTTVISGWIPDRGRSSLREFHP
jgi:hypothetical protein